MRETAEAGPVRRPVANSLIDMTMNMPPEPQDCSLIRRLREGLVSLLRRGRHVQPAALTGFRWHRRGSRSWCVLVSRHVPGVTAVRIVVCPGPGIDNALMGLFSALARVGDTIACEAINYPGIKGLASPLGIKLIGLAVDDDGIDPDAFAALCAVEPPKVLYCIPVVLNPTAAISQERREAIAAIARRYSVPMIEDDAYGCLPAKRPASIAPELTFCLTGFTESWCGSAHGLHRHPDGPLHCAGFSHHAYRFGDGITFYDETRHPLYQ